MTVDLEHIARFAGRLHPLIVHFPIALLMVGAGIELVSAARRRSRPSPTGLACLVMGWLGACAAAGAGWLDAAYEQPDDQSLILAAHRWIGVGVAAFSAIVLLLAWPASKGGRGLGLYRTGLILSAFAVAIGAHLGGSMAYGESYLSDALATLVGKGESSRAERAGAPTVADVHFPADGVIDFSTHVKPILEASCIECHSDQKHKGGLALDDRADAIQGGESGPSIEPGKPMDSPLIRRVLGLDDEARMPLKRPALPDEQVKILKAWIEQGAKWPDVGGSQR